MSHEAFVSDISTVVPVPVEDNDFPATTINDLYASRIDSSAANVAFACPNNGTWDMVTWAEAAELIASLRKSLVNAGVEAGTVVGILGTNSYEWAATAMAVTLLGGVVVGLWEEADLASLHWQISHAQPSIIFVGDNNELDKVTCAPGASDFVNDVIMFSGEVPEGEGSERAIPSGVATGPNTSFEAGQEHEHRPFSVWSLAKFLSSGAHGISDALLERRSSKVAAGMTAVLAYTSGTTGTPKAAMLSHDNIAYAAQGLGTALQPIESGDHVLSYLSLGVITNLIFDIFASLVTGAVVWFGPADSASSTILPVIQDVRPTFFNGYPRVWEDLARACLASGAEASADVLGMDRCRFAASSGGFLPPHVTEFFVDAGIYLVQIYGTAETSGVAAVSSEVSPLVSVGVPLGSTTIALADENEDGDGVLAVAGRTVFKGYFKDDVTSRRRVLDSGFFVTGDVGRVDDGYVFVHGNKRDMLKVGEDNFVAPAPVEALLKAQLPIVSDVLVFGSQHDKLCAFITLKSVVEGAGPVTDELSVHAGAILDKLNIDVESDAISDLVQDDRIKAIVDRAVGAYNDSLDGAGCAIDQWTFVRPFAVANRELTPSFKTKRRVVLDHYQDQAKVLLDAASSSSASSFAAANTSIGINGNDSIIGGNMVYPAPWLGSPMVRPLMAPIPAPRFSLPPPFASPFAAPFSPLQFFMSPQRRLFDDDE